MAAPLPRPWHALRTEAVQRALAAPVRARTAHFVLHCVLPTPVVRDLRTAGAPESARSVDNSAGAASTGLGFVVPKRWAKRAVTRNLIRREMREAARRHEQQIERGASVLVRQRAGLDRTRFASAASVAMRDAVRAELNQLFLQLSAA